MKRGSRTEKDYLGSKKIPSSAYYGVQTKRALENFPISNLHLQKELVYAITIIKKAAAITNKKNKRLEPKKANAIVKACNEILKGKFDSQFPIDVFQAGAGTSENMNINEVIANRALQILKKKKGSYNYLHPNDHVNLAQSTNDVFHSAIYISAYTEIKNNLLPTLEHLEKELNKKLKAFSKIKKSGRTHLMDAVPITLGQEFSGYKDTIKQNKVKIKETSKELLNLNIGGTAIGTGINTTQFYQKNIVKEINKITKEKFKKAENLIEATQNINPITNTGSSLKNLALNLIKIANDLRLLNSGPSSGLAEISLPSVQPGSSIMPAKVNPVMAEMLDMVSFQVLGNDTTINLCAQAGQLELNVMVPLAAYNLLHSIEILNNSIKIFTEKCVKGITANKKKTNYYLEKNPIIVTALTPHIGYEKAAQIAKEAYKKDKSIRELIIEKNLMDKKTLNKILNAEI
ncbi:aspartate ammonia-lyase [archaeon]|nr:aspartate ammonia-lyase [archaeon]|tara:strand:- start:27359 stop:28738 length:1380 start_codon:yes stop_codon:yes gene_type:complete